MSPASRRRLGAVGLATVAALAALTTSAPSSSAAPKEGKVKGPKPVEVQLLALNDFHGNLEPPSGSGGRIQTSVTTGADGVVRALA